MNKLAIILTALMVSISALASDHKESLVKNGEQIPIFQVTTLDGEKISVSELKGKVVLINFFATWCGPCMKELPEVEKQLWPRFKDKNFVMVAIGREHTKEQLKAFNEKKGFSFPMAPDPKREIFSKFANQNIPRNFIVDKSGKIIFQGVGFSQEELDVMIKIINDSL